MGKNKNTRKSPAFMSKKLKRSTASQSDLNRTDIEANYQEATSSKSGNVVPNWAYTHQEKVFFIDHIMESIFLKCDQNTLLRCRLVSRRSEYFATKALQKVVDIRFSRDKYQTSFPHASNFHLCFRHIFYSGCQKRSIPGLVDLLNKSAEFPCTSFSFFNDSVSPATPAFVYFLNSHASRVEKLKLIGKFYLEDFRKLIFVLASNVNEVCVDHVSFEANNQLSDEETTEDEDDNYAEPAPQEQSPLISTVAKPLPVLKSLKIFECKSRIPATIIHQILEACPSLTQVSLHHSNLHCLVQPKNFLHLLKKLVIDISPNCDKDFESLQFVANNHENNLVVEEFEFSGYTQYKELKETLRDSVEKILQGCSATCTTLVLKSILLNFKTPVMPRVKHLKFPYQRSSLTRQPRNIFPQGASLCDTFPSLRTLHINSELDVFKVPIENIFGGGHHSSSFPNVKKVTLEFWSFSDALVRNFQKMFPTATIHVH